MMRDLQICCAVALLFGTGCHKSIFTTQRSDTAANLFAVWGSGPDDVYVVGTNATILHTRDHGKTWISQGTWTTEHLFSIWGNGPDDVYAGGIGTLLHTTDRSGSWASMNVPVPKDPLPFNVRTGAGSSRDVLYIGGDGVLGPYRSSDGGITWQMIPAPSPWNVESISQRPSGEVYITGGYSFGDGVVLRSRDEGVTTETMKSGVSGYSTGLWLDDTDMFVVGERGQIAYSGDHGATFSRRDSEFTNYDDGLAGVWGTSGTNIYAVGNYGHILHSEDRGHSWDLIPTGTDTPLRAIWGSGPDDIYAVGFNGLILHYP